MVLKVRGCCKVYSIAVVTIKNWNPVCILEIKFINFLNLSVSVPVLLPQHMISAPFTDFLCFLFCRADQLDSENTW